MLHLDCPWKLIGNYKKKIVTKKGWCSCKTFKLYTNSYGQQSVDREFLWGLAQTECFSFRLLIWGLQIHNNRSQLYMVCIHREFQLREDSWAQPKMLPVSHWRSLFWSSDVPLVVLASLKQGSVGCRVQTTNRLIREILRNAHFSGQVLTCS